MHGDDSREPSTDQTETTSKMSKGFPPMFPGKMVTTSLNTNFEDSLVDVSPDPCIEDSLVRQSEDNLFECQPFNLSNASQSPSKGERAKGVETVSELKNLLDRDVRSGFSLDSNRLGEYEVFGRREEAGCQVGGELRRLLEGAGTIEGAAPGPGYGRCTLPGLGPGRSTQGSGSFPGVGMISRQQGLEIFICPLLIPHTVPLSLALGLRWKEEYRLIPTISITHSI